MTIDQVRAIAHQRWGNNTARGVVWLTPGGWRAVGWIDGQFRYCMGIGDTWEAAFARADEILREQTT